MPMMVISDDLFEKELNKLSSNQSSQKPVVEIIEPKQITSLDLINKVIDAKVVDIKRGRGNTLEIPSGIRALIAEEALNGTDPNKISEEFGISKSSISAYKNDATSTKSYHSPDEALKNSNDLVRDDISNQARTKLQAALEHITDDKLASAKLRDIASVASSMSGIIKNLEPNGPTNVQNTQVIVYKPRMREEDDFEVITVNE